MPRSTLLNALIGAVVTVVTAFLPFSPAIGGAVAAYLDGGTRRSATRVGALSGLIVVLPLTPLVLLALALAPFDFGISFVVIVGVLVFVAVYAIALGAIGGLLAAYLLGYPTRTDRIDAA